MQDLNFRRKRRKTAVRKENRGRKISRGRNLRFEEKKRTLHFEKQGRRAGRKRVKGLMSWIAGIVIACLAAVLVVSLFGMRVSNAGDSMNPVLGNGDVVLIDRLTYKLGKPSRGDIIAFRESDNIHYSIKRVAGLPGETVQIIDGSILINGEEMTEGIYAEDIAYAGTAADPVELGKDEYFVIGDNHEASDDSRIASVGNIKRSDIYGKVWFVADSEDHFGLIKD